MYLVFDTETTGLPVRAPRGAPPIPADDPRQPRLASFAGILCDAEGTPTDSFMYYVKPEGWTMKEFDDRARAEGKTPASEINGLTDEFLQDCGLPVADVLNFYSRQIAAGTVVCAFNAIFDTKIMRGELRRAGRADLFEQTRNICLMRAMDAYAPDGLCMSRPGFVSLSVACEFLGIKQEEAHEAMSDARDAHQILMRLMRDGRLPAPTITHAANYQKGAA